MCGQRDLRGRCALKHLNLSILILALGLVLPASALAQSVCGQTRYFDERDPNQVLRSNAYGSRFRISDFETNRPVSGVRLLVYDQDGSCVDFQATCSETDDDYIGVVTSNLYGNYCIDVPTNDDVYLVTFYDLGAYGGSTVHGRVYTDAGGYLVSNSPVTWNVPSGVTRTLNFNLSCPTDTDGNCAQGVATLRPYANLLATMAEVRDRTRSWWGIGETNGGQDALQVYYPDHPIEACPSSGGRTYDEDEICVANYNGWVLPHEIGHALHLRLLDGVTGTLANCGSSWSWNSQEGDQCATSEGWADFVANANNWYYWATAPNHVNDSQKEIEGYTANINSGSARCISISSDPESRPGNVTRFFWDLFDSTTIGDDGYDAGPGSGNNVSFYTISQNWASFPAGTGNRQASEAGPDGRNVNDFVYYMSAASGERYQNCLSGQEP